ncbi:hypothetical protein ARMSODRAFT_1027354 [Armillaria solidipes]|uniref:Uncharacterized protein n=1 Tax=Armillaria solidipes TaxID=1076256 RepID=A0A2H3ARY8_9AGAR|nr:hypothetical protein ARMSODRAFT_1027354 [Armillaria solidipes]
MICLRSRCRSNGGAPLPDLPPEQGPKIVHEPLEKSEIPNGQRLRETWQDFFARREAKNVLRREKESEQSRQVRLQREEHARQFKIPGSKGAHVFVWMLNEDKGYLVRKHVAVSVPRHLDPCHSRVGADATASERGKKLHKGPALSKCGQE